MKIKGLQLENPFFLAPMEAVNCASFRVLCRRRGASLVYTDMIDADKFVEYADEHSIVEAVKYYINPQEDEQPLAVQLGGRNVENLMAVYETVKEFASLIDYNIGCPLGYMLGKKGGCYLMKHPDQLEKILKELREGIKLPFTLKIRSGWDENNKNAVEVAKLAERIGMDAITIHPRTREQRYMDRADWQLARKVKEAVNIPVILSGDVVDAESARKAFEVTQCDAVMLARAAKNRPSIFKHMEHWKEKCVEEVTADFKEWLSLYKERESRYKISEIRDHALWTIRGAKNARDLKENLLKQEKEKRIIEVVSTTKF